MALAEYTDVYTLEDFVPRVSAIESAVNAWTTNEMVQLQKQKLEGQIKFFQQQEQNLYGENGLNLPEGERNINGLRKRIKEYKKATLYFSGPYLREKIIGILEAENQKAYVLFKTQVQYIVDNEIVPLIGRKIANNNEIIKDIDQAYLYYLNTSTGRGNRSPFTVTRNLFVENQIITEALTRNQRKFWQKKLGSNAGSIDIDKNMVIFNWFDNTSKFTRKEIEALVHNSDSTIRSEAEKFLNKANENISDYLINMTDGESQQYISDIIKYILSKDQYAFFVGINTNDIVGLCGEISSMYYLYMLLGHTPNLLGSRITWQGGLYIGNKGKKPHIDVLLQELFGIQVKNTTKKTLDQIYFADASLDTILDKLKINNSLRHTFENYYATRYFNVGWNREDGIYVHDQQNPYGLNQAGKARDKAKLYLDTYNKLENMEDQVEQLLAFSAAALLYMGVRMEVESKLDANIIYQIGADGIYVASEILSEIYKVIEDTKKLADTFYVEFSRSEDGRTIVEALNIMSKNGKSAAKYDKKIKSTRTDKSYSNQVLKKVILTSSFNFGSLEIA